MDGRRFIESVEDRFQVEPYCARFFLVIWSDGVTEEWESPSPETVGRYLSLFYTEHQA